MFTVKTNSPEETFYLGERLASYLPSGIVIALTGELGAGKTLFAKGIAQGLKVREHVTSPTFTIINEYQGRVPLFHMDAYRLEEENEIEELGLEEYFNSSGITLIEWPERIHNFLPMSFLKIDLKKAWDQSGKEYRMLSFAAVGKEWDYVIGEFERDENTGN